MNRALGAAVGPGPAAAGPEDPGPEVRAVTEVVLPGLVEPSGLVVRTATRSAPGPGQAGVRVDAAGVSFAEQGMRRGRYPGQPPFPFVPGYDLVGTVTEVGAGVDPALIGRRVAALTKTGAWTTWTVRTAADLVPVPDEVDAGKAETVLVNGVTAWQMLHRKARVGSGAAVLVHGANGGVGSVLVQLARHAGARVVGTAHPRHHDRLRALGVEPVDYREDGLAARLRAVAPGGFDAVFDHLGGESFRRSFGLLRRGGTLVCYGTAAQVDAGGSVLLQFVRIFGRLAVRTVLPNGRSATFYNLWGGRRRVRRFRRRLHEDLSEVLRLLSEGVLTAHVAERFPLTQAAAAMELAESRTVLGKVVLEPQRTR
nr:medium chain dehydrogenase/reductase family protein [Nakamurella endophytica]